MCDYVRGDLSHQSPYVHTVLSISHWCVFALIMYYMKSITWSRRNCRINSGERRVYPATTTITTLYYNTYNQIRCPHCSSLTPTHTQTYYTNPCSVSHDYRRFSYFKILHPVSILQSQRLYCKEQNQHKLLYIHPFISATPTQHSYSKFAPKIYP